MPVTTRSKKVETKTKYKPKTESIKKPPKKTTAKKYNALFDQLNIDETYTNPKGQKRVKYDKVKDLIVPKQDYAFQADLLMLPKTKKDYRYLLVIVDLWSDEVDAQELKTKQPQEVLQAMKTIFKRPHLNKPFYIRTDAGTEFKGNMADYLFDHSIFHSIALPGRHKQMGNVENVNKLLGRFLMTYLSNKEKKLKAPYNEWTDILRTVITEINKIRKRPDGDPFKPHKPANMDLIEKQKFKVGDLVYRKLDIPKNSMNNFEKSNPKFRMGDMRYDIEEPKKIKYVLYYPNNVRYVLNGFPNVSYTEEELKFAENETDEKYAVRKIWDKKIIKKKIFYMVWWKKYLKKNSTWEPKNSLIEDGFEDEINDFENN
jgi:hypothetical protein